MMVNKRYWNEVKSIPFLRYRGTEIKSPTIQKNQFSILRFAISHIPTKKIAVVNTSTYSVGKKCSKPKATPSIEKLFCIKGLR